MIKMICFPFAGGNVYSYDIFSECLPSNFSLETIEYPGRGLKIREDLLLDMNILIENLFLEFVERVNNTQYVIYGHSMGALVAYLIAKKAEENNFPPPIALFLTGTSAVGLESFSQTKFNMSDNDFLHTLRDLGGSHDEIINNSDFMEFFLPILRSDFEAYEKFEYKEMRALETPIYVLIGTNDTVSENQARLWKRRTKADFEFIQLPGTHFFIFDHVPKIITYIRDKTEKHISL